MLLKSVCFWWLLVQIRWADDRGGRSGGKSGIYQFFRLTILRFLVALGPTFYRDLENVKMRTLRE